MSHALDSDVRFGHVYARLAPQLRRILSAHLRAPECVIEDACQAAWEALLVHRETVDESRVLSWLATTGRREALQMLRRAEFERRLLTRALPSSPTDPRDPEQVSEFWDRLGEVRRLSRHQQRIVWMQGMGFRYREIAADLGETTEAIERQLRSARRHLDRAA